MIRKNLFHLLFGLIIIVNLALSFDKLLTKPTAPFSQAALTAQPKSNDYSTLFSALYPYDNALEYPWVNIDPSSKLYQLVIYKEQFQRHDQLFLSSKRAAELVKYGSSLNQPTWEKQLANYEALMRVQLETAKNLSDYQERLVEQKQLFLNLLQHQHDLKRVLSDSIVRSQEVSILFSSLLSELPRIFREDEFVYYFPSTILTDREVGLFEITLFRDSELWREAYINDNSLDHLWQDNQIIFQEIIDDENDHIRMRNPYERNAERKFGVEDVHKLPIISARKIESLEGLSPNAEQKHSEYEAQLVISDFTLRDTNRVLAQKASGWSITKVESPSVRSQIITLEYVSHEQAIKKIVLISAILFLYVAYVKYFQQILRKINQLRKKYRLRYLDNIFVLAFLITLGTMLPLIVFIIISVLFTLYTLLYLNDGQIFRRTLLVLVIMALLHSLQLNLFAERLSYFIIYLVIGLVLMKFSKVKMSQ